MRRRVRLLALSTGLVTTLGIALYARHTGLLLWATVAVCAGIIWAMWRIASRPEPR